MVVLEIPDWVLGLVVAGAVMQALATAWQHLTLLSLRALHRESMSELQADMRTFVSVSNDDSDTESDAPYPAAPPLVARTPAAAASSPIVINMNRSGTLTLSSSDPGSAPRPRAGAGGPTHAARRSSGDILQRAAQSGDRDSGDA